MVGRMLGTGRRRDAMGRGRTDRGCGALLVVAMLGAICDADAIADQPPGALLDLARWKLTLPVDTDRPGHPDEIEWPELRSFVDPQYFFATEKSAAVVFRAHCGGVPTRGSRFPRCELREMTEGGKRPASWSTADDRWHTMSMRMAITHLPRVKRHLVCAQIHDAEDDLMMVRLEGTKLFIERNSVGDVMLERKYVLGTPFDLKIQAGRGRVRVWYDERLHLDWPVQRSGCYFKVGCYAQSNVREGDLPEAFGEVRLYRLDVQPRF